MVIWSAFIESPTSPAIASIDIFLSYPLCFPPHSNHMSSLILLRNTLIGCVTVGDIHRLASFHHLHQHCHILVNQALYLPTGFLWEWHSCQNSFLKNLPVMANGFPLIDSVLLPNNRSIFISVLWQLWRHFKVLDESAVGFLVLGFFFCCCYYYRCCYLILCFSLTWIFFF